MRRGVTWMAIVVGALMALSVLPQAGAAGRPGRPGDRDGDKILDELERAIDASDGAPVDVIALFTEGESKSKAAAARADVGAFEATYEYRSMPGFAASLTPGQVRSLAARPDVASLELNAKLEFQMESARAASGVDKARTDFPMVDGNNELSLVCPGVREYCKDDVVIAIVDSGLDKWHVDLDGGKVLGGAECSDGTCDPLGSWTLDTERHGTAVASIAAGEGDGNAAARGIAPGAALVGVKVGGTLSPTVASVDAGLEWVLAHKDVYGIDIVNMSLSSTTPSDGTNSTSRLTNKLAVAGITPFASAGNGNPEPGKTGFPAAAEQAIAVGNMADPGTPVNGDGAGFVLSLGSKRGPTLDGRIKPDILSHGINIMGAESHTTNGYSFNYGTSFSSPFAAGVGALMLDANPSLAPSGVACPAGDSTPDCMDGVVDATMTAPVKQKMMESAQDWGGAGKDSDYGAGRLDAYAAVDSASLLVGTGGPVVPAHAHFSGTLAPGATATHPVEVTSTQYAITAAMIMKDRAAGATTPDFDLTMLSPSGAVIASSQFTEQNHRQENVSFQPTATGTYSLRIRAASGSGVYWLDVSYPGVQGATPTPTPPPTPTPTPTPPDAPSGLTATPVAGSTSSIDLAWGDVATETSYKVERSLDGSTGWTQIATTSANVTTYRSSGLAPSTDYFYRVRASNAGADSGYSNVASARTNADTTAPTAPTNVKAAAGKGRATITWSASTDTGSGVAGYRVFRATASTGPFTQVWTTTSLSYVDQPLVKGKTYWYYVVAFDNAGNTSPASATVSVRPT